MLNIPEVIKGLFLQDGVRKNFRVHFPNGERADLVNKDIIEESVRFTESTCSQQTLRFGLTEASVIEFECVGVENIAGMTIECGIEIDVSSLSREERIAYGTRSDDVDFPFYAVPYGVFVVDKCPRQADMKRRKVTGYTDISRDRVLPLGGWYKSKSLKLSAGALANLIGAGDIECDPFYEVKRVRFGVYDDDKDYPQYAVLSYQKTSANYWAARVSVHDYEIGKDALILKRTLSREFDHDEVVKAKIDYTPHEYDGAADAIFDGYVLGLTDISVNGAPGFYGRSPYNPETSSGVSMVKNANTLTYNALHYITGRPQIQVVMKKAGVLYFAYPHFVSPNEWVIVDLNNEVFDVNVSIDSSCTFCLWFSIPYTWDVGNSAPMGRSGAVLNYYKTNGEMWFQFGVTSWPIQQKETRKGDIKAYYKASKAFGETLVLTPSLSTKFKAIGDAYRYDAAIPQEDAANGVLAMFGLFGDIKRIGVLDVKKLSRTGSEALLRGIIRSLWYDENETEKIGAVMYSWDDGDGDDNYLYTVSEDGSATYDMTQNKALGMLEDKTQAAIEEALQDFGPNVAEATYTPIDAAIKGLPWLEDGDAIRIEAEDGTMVDTYILRHTISGVQHLEDEITAEGAIR